MSTAVMSTRATNLGVRKAVRRRDSLGMNYLCIREVIPKGLSAIIVKVADTRQGEWCVEFKTTEEITLELDQLAALLTRKVYYTPTARAPTPFSDENTQCHACQHILAALGGRRRIVVKSKIGCFFQSSAQKFHNAQEVQFFLNDFLAACMMHFCQPEVADYSCDVCVEVYRRLRRFFQLKGCIHHSSSPCMECPFGEPRVSERFFARQTTIDPPAWLLGSGFLTILPIVTKKGSSSKAQGEQSPARKPKIKGGKIRKLLGR